MNHQAIKCLVIDDDKTISDLIQHFCTKVESIEFCIACNNPIDGLKLISSENFDLIFLDYNMPDINGKMLLDLKQDSSKVIMITSNTEFAIESYDYPAVIDYLLKPISFERFYKAIERFKTTIQSTPAEGEEKGVTFVKDGNKWVKVSLEDVFYIKSESNYVVWELSQKQILSLQNLKALELQLPDNFKRIHRSYIINTQKMDYFTTEEVNINGKMIPVGMKYKDVLKTMLKNLQ
ncbi:MAG: response regulator transcription factor [Saprospiraceae bacterium]|nr:response regulator transcription factor [Saprospiraceae bacterium]